MSRLIVLPLFCLILICGCTMSTPPVNDEDYSQYPNPFCPSTIVSFDMPESGHVTLVMYNILGEVVDTLVNDSLQAGYFEVTLDNLGLDSGVYFCRLFAGEIRESKKIVLIK